MKISRCTTQTLAERFWSKVDASGDCWEWTAARNDRGYGAFRSDRWEAAHRVAFRLERGDIPEGMSVLHHCDNPACVNPDHLFVGTIAENNADKASKGRAPRIVGWSKIDAAQAERIRGMLNSGAKQRDVASEFGLSQSSVSRIANGIAWSV